MTLYETKKEVLHTEVVLPNTTSDSPKKIPKNCLRTYDFV